MITDRFERIAELHKELKTLVEPLGCEVQIVPKAKVKKAPAKKANGVAKKEKRGLSRGEAKKIYWAAIREICEKDGLTKAEAIATYRRRKLELAK